MLLEQLSHTREKFETYIELVKADINQIRGDNNKKEIYL